jgi:hypothetical protein
MKVSVAMGRIDAKSQMVRTAPPGTTIEHDRAERNVQSA